MKALRKVLGFAIAGLALGVHGPLLGADFSAEMVQRGPGIDTISGSMFVSGQQTRTEMTHQSRKIVRISDRQRGVEWMLFPDQRQYLERQMQPQGAPHGAPADPCTGMTGVTCRKLGEENLAGRAAIKWEMIATHEGRTMKSTQWLDKERGVPLRQEFPDGRTTELRPAGTETLGGRPTEKWEMLTTEAGKPAVRTFQWYDPALELAVRQELPGGYVSELRNLQLGPQPAELFTIPAGYERIAMPAGVPGQPTPGR